MEPICDDHDVREIDDLALLSLFKRLSIGFAMASTGDAMNKLEPKLQAAHDEIHRRMLTGEGVTTEPRNAARLREERVVVRTTWNFAGQVEQLVDTPSGVMQRRVLNTMESQVRDALVAMGWTPPKR